MFSPWNSFDEQTLDSMSDISAFRPQENLWLKLAENLDEQSTGTSAFLTDTIEHFLRESESKSEHIKQLR